MTQLKFDSILIRQTLIHTLPEETSLHGDSPGLSKVFLPPSHIKALSPDIPLVVGMRGAGKSFWWSALQSPQHRQLLAWKIPEMKNLEVRVGFGEVSNPSAYPGRDSLKKLLESGFEPRIIWKSIVVNALQYEELNTFKSWNEKVRWVSSNPDNVEGFLYKANEKYKLNKQTWLILFDALDRTSSNWSDMDKLLRGLLQLALELRPYSNLRAKCFLRTDQLEGRKITDFPDASKLLASKMELNWIRRDLYNLLWQYLINASNSRGSEQFRQGMEYLGYHLTIIEDIYQIDSSPPQEEEKQKRLLHLITGDWMGRDHRRGFPYSWIVGHLADAQGRTSPRSFLAALRTAAMDTNEKHSSHLYALYYDSIRIGVKAASSIRVNELKEDYPWIETLMAPLRGMVVPMEFEKIKKSWIESDSINNISSEERLPPEHLKEGPEGVCEDLVQLGLFQQMTDGRINMPDLFRIGFGLGRKGGVKPVS